MPHPVELIRRIAERHGIQGEPRLLPDSGMVNEAWMLGEDFVLRIIVMEDTDDEAERESIIVPLVRAAGVRSPELIAVNLECDLAPRPYTIYERARGELLGHLSDPPESFERLYRETGREIALLNSIPVSPELIPKLRKGSLFDAHQQLEKSLAAEKISESDAAELRIRLEELRSLFGESPAPALLHQDIHPWNLFVDTQSHELTAIIDWGDTAFGDPAAEFASMPLAAIPAMLEGYADAGGEVKQGLVARALCIGIALSLWEQLDLDPARFARQWWRTPIGGWEETWKYVDKILKHQR